MGGQGDVHRGLGDSADTAILGGFNGTEQTRDASDPETNETTIDWRGKAGSAVRLKGSGATLDGFVVKGGTWDKRGDLGQSGDGRRWGVVQEGGRDAPGEHPSEAMQDRARPGREGGGIAIIDAGSGEIWRCKVSHCEAGTGAGIYMEGSTISITETECFMNTADIGGGVALRGTGSATIEGCVIYANRATSGGGGISVQGAAKPLRYNVISGNATMGSGAGVMSEMAHGIELMEGNWIAGNWAGVDGAGVKSFQSVRLYSNMILGNKAGRSGGGARMDVDGKFIAVINSTFVSNDASQGGGLCARIVGSNVYNQIKNNLFAENRGYAIDASESTAHPDGVEVNGFWASDEGVYKDHLGNAYRTASELNGHGAASGNLDLDPSFLGVPGLSEIRINYSTSGYPETPTNLATPTGNGWSLPGVANDGQRYYATIWVSKDGGATWTPAGQATVTSVDLTPPAAPVLEEVTPSLGDWEDHWVGGSVVLRGASSRDTALVRVKLPSGEMVEAGWTGPSSWATVEVGLANGKNRIELWAYDSANNLNKGTCILYADRQAPRVRIHCPAPGNRVTADR